MIDNSRRIVVLVVEDEPVLRMMAVDMVENAGCEAAEASNVDEALCVLEARNDVTVVFADIAMPGLRDGRDLASYISGRWPSIPVILTSGQHARHQVQVPSPGAFFAKPYSRAHVVEAIRQLA